MFESVVVISGLDYAYTTSLGLSHPPPSWDVIPPDHTISRHVEVLVSSEATILSVDNSECIDQVSF
jgi:hypothetical protein